MLLVIILLVGPTSAGDGPWVLRAGARNLYVGGDLTRFSEYDGAAEDQPLGTTVSTSGLTAIWSGGMGRALEAELMLPVEASRVMDPSAAICGDEMPEHWCDRTLGVGEVQAGVKLRVMDELALQPVTLSLRLGVRSGELSAQTRRRLTNLGDGSTDFGGAVSVGRTDVLGAGWFRLSATAGYWYALPNVVEGGSRYPGDEVDGDMALVFSPDGRVSLGPEVAFFTRLTGDDLSAIGSSEDYDAWGRLRGGQIKAGGKIGFYTSDSGLTLSAAVLRTAVAWNNPSDTLSVSVGVGRYLAPPEQDR